MSLRFPSATSWPSTLPTIPSPGKARKPSGCSRDSPRAAAASTMAAASGCSLPRSRLAARRRSFSSPPSPRLLMAASRGRPSVSVPVLSTTSVSTVSNICSASASRISTPAPAPCPVATITDMGVARPRAHGQATMRTATAATNACAMRGCGPSKLHAAKVPPAATTTAGTNHAATTSATCWMGARLRCASLTIRTICASSVSEPTRSARITKLPVPLTVAPTSRSPGCFSTGKDSPVIMDSSTELLPSRSTPSTGTFSPGRTRRRAPRVTLSSGTSVSTPSSPSNRAVGGASSSRARSAPPVRSRARNSRT